MKVSSIIIVIMFSVVHFSHLYVTCCKLSMYRHLFGMLFSLLSIRYSFPEQKMDDLEKKEVSKTKVRKSASIKTAASLLDVRSGVGS